MCVMGAPVRLAVAGCGSIGQRHMGHIAEHPELVLAACIDPNPAAAIPKGVARLVRIEDMGANIDGLVIATPTQTHLPLAEHAAGRGLPILIEKPLAATLDEADRIVGAVEGAGIASLAGHHRRHHPRITALRGLLAEGAIGTPVVASGLWAVRKPDGYFDAPWRAGVEGAPVLQNMIHDIDLLRFLLGEVAEVTGLGSAHVRGAGRTETGGLVFRFESGAVATIAFSDAAPSPWGFEAGTGENPGIAATGQDCLFITGTAGGVAFPSLTLWTGARDWTEAPMPQGMAVPDGVPLVRQLEHFAAVIRGEAAPLIDARDARASLAVTLQALEVTRCPRSAAA